MKKPGGIYFRLVVPLAASILVAMLIAWAIAAQLLSNNFERRVDEQLDHATTIIANGEFPFSPDLLTRLDRLIEARIALLDGAGVVRMSSESGSANDALAILADEIRAIQDGDVHFVSSGTGADAWRIAVRAIGPQRDSRFQYVAASASLADSREASRGAALLLGAAILVAGLLLAWFASSFTRGITRPIGELATMANRIADGERDLSSGYAENNEIGQLARALNDMATRLQQYETDLGRQSHLAGLGDLAARLAHEIRNPLTAIKMQLQLLEEQISDSNAGRIQTLLNELRRMELIVESALTLGAPLELVKRNVQPGTIIDELAELVRPTLHHRNIELRTQCDQTSAIEADPDKLKQVLLNLINNAADELDDGGIIRVSVVNAEGDVELIVEDSGPGYEPEPDPSRQKKPFGLGIGLTICKEIIEAHHGTLTADGSTELGGARFTIRLNVPIINDPEPAA